MRLLISLLFLFLFSSTVFANTYYVRPEGGDRTRCNGRTSDPDPGSGTGQNCAVNHPYQIFPPFSSTPNLGFSAGDTLIVYNGTYVFGYDAPNSTQYAGCAGAEYECKMGTIPSGTDAQHRTKIYGIGWNLGCNTKPVFEGRNRLTYMISLGTNTSNFDMRCIEMTDGDDCIESLNHTDNTCPTSAPYTALTNARVALDATKVANVNLEDIYIHGMGTIGINASGSDWTMHNLVLKGNKVGWDGDTGTYPTTTGDTGTMDFDNVVIQFNGCAEDYPIVGSPVYRNCITGNAYSDGLGTDSTDAKYIFRKCNVSHNNQDGIDLLYGTASSEVDVYQCVLEGNDGNQLKIKSGIAHIENNIIIGNCCYLYDTAQYRNTCTTNCPGEGTPTCRAGGQSIALTMLPGGQYHFVNNTVTGEGDILFMTGDTASGCNATEIVEWKNNIALGSHQCVAAQSWDTTDFHFFAGTDTVDCPNPTVTNSVVHQTKDDVGAACPTGATCGDPNLAGVTWVSDFITFANDDGIYDGGDIYPTASSALLLDNGDNTATCSGDCSKDVNNVSRGASWDIGGVEKDSVAYCSNGVQDHGESGIDCGGSFCIACPSGSRINNITPIGSIKFQ